MCISLPKRYTAKAVADATGGYPPSVGRVADDVLAELVGRGIKVKYLKAPKSIMFIIYEGINT